MRNLLNRNYKEQELDSIIRVVSRNLLKLGFKFNHFTEGNEFEGFKATLDIFYNDKFILEAPGEGDTENNALASSYIGIMGKLHSITHGLTEDYVTLPNSEEYCTPEFVIYPDEKKEYNKEGYIKELRREFGLRNEGSSIVDKFLRLHVNSLHNYYGYVPLDKYTNLITGEDVYINSILHQGLMEGTTGICSGTSKYEALVEGLSDIIEKQVHYMLYKDPMSMPIIPDGNLTEFARVIKREFELEGRFKMEVRDASLGRGFPVICIILYDKIIRGYTVSLGSFPVMRIAINRAVSNLMAYRFKNNMIEFRAYEPMNYSQRYMRTIDGQDVDVEEYYDAQNMYLSESVGVYKDKLFSDEFDYEFKPWEISQLKSNEELFYDLVKLINKEFNTNIIYKEISYLGMPAYSIMCPEMSIDQFVGLNKVYTTLVQDRGCVEEFIYGGLEDTVKFIEEYFSLPNMTNLDNMLGRPTKYGGFTITYLDGYVEFIKGNYEEASRIMTQKELVLDRVDDNHKFRVLDLFNCLENYIGLKASIINEQEIVGILLKFYSEDIVHTVYNACKDYKTLANALFIDPESELCLVDWERHEINKEIIKVMREKKKEYFTD